MSQIIRPQATIDIDEISDYLEQQRPGYGQRFLQELAVTLGQLEQMPGLGGVFALTAPALAGLRHFPVSRFPRYITFYLPIQGGIDVLRVLHAARDLATILESEG
jgi:toxin ParE1/3/4